MSDIFYNLKIKEEQIEDEFPEIYMPSLDLFRNYSTVMPKLEDDLPSLLEPVCELTESDVKVEPKDEPMTEDIVQPLQSKPMEELFGEPIFPPATFWDTRSGSEYDLEHELIGEQKQAQKFRSKRSKRANNIPLWIIERELINERNRKQNPEEMSDFANQIECLEDLGINIEEATERFLPREQNLTPELLRRAEILKRKESELYHKALSEFLAKNPVERTHHPSKARMHTPSELSSGIDQETRRSNNTKSFESRYKKKVERAVNAFTVVYVRERILKYNCRMNMMQEMLVQETGMFDDIPYDEAPDNCSDTEIKLPMENTANQRETVIRSTNNSGGINVQFNNWSKSNAEKNSIEVESSKEEEEDAIEVDSSSDEEDNAIEVDSSSEEEDNATDLNCSNKEVSKNNEKKSNKSSSSNDLKPCEVLKSNTKSSSLISSSFYSGLSSEISDSTKETLATYLTKSSDSQLMSTLANLMHTSPNTPSSLPSQIAAALSEMNEFYTGSDPINPSSAQFSNKTDLYQQTIKLRKMHVQQMQSPSLEMLSQKTSPKQNQSEQSTSHRLPVENLLSHPTSSQQMQPQQIQPQQTQPHKFSIQEILSNSSSAQQIRPQQFSTQHVQPQQIEQQQFPVQQIQLHQTQFQQIQPHHVPSQQTLLHSTSAQQMMPQQTQNQQFSFQQVQPQHIQLQQMQMQQFYGQQMQMQMQPYSLHGMHQQQMATSQFSMQHIPVQNLYAYPTNAIRMPIKEMPPHQDIGVGRESTYHIPRYEVQTYELPTRHWMPQPIPFTNPVEYRLCPVDIAYPPALQPVIRDYPSAYPSGSDSTTPSPPPSTGSPWRSDSDNPSSEETDFCRMSN